VGSQLVLAGSAAGKAILSHLPDDERDELLGADASPELIEDLVACRKNTFAIDYGEVDPSLCSIAAAVLDSEGYPVAAVCVSSLVYVLSRDDLAAMSDAVVAAADEISRRL
jgi:IclR family acetate operon transcriptional repressor